ncbi:unnamed protein product, partial [marine sediment metagenome]
PELKEENNIQIICNRSSSFRETNPLNWFVNFYILQGIIDASNKFNCRFNFTNSSSKDLTANKPQGTIVVQDAQELI